MGLSRLSNFFLLLSWASTVLGQAGGDLSLLISGYTDTVFRLGLDSQSLLFFDLDAQRLDPSMTWLTWDEEGRSLFAGHEVDDYLGTGDGAITRWTVDGSGFLSRQEWVPTQGAGTCHLQLDRDRRLIYAANYLGGSLAVYRLEEGDAPGELALGGLAFTDSFPDAGTNGDPERQEASHVHGSWTYGDKFVYFPDLGADSIYHYRLVQDETTGLWNIERADPETTSLPIGSGPRHLAVDSDSGLVYLLNELRNAVDVFSVDEDTGELTLATSVNYDVVSSGADPDEVQNGAEIALHPERPLLYISHRGFGAILVFDVVSAGDGYLAQKQVMPLEGTWPRHFSLTPDLGGLVAVSRFENTVETFALDVDEGTLTPRASTVLPAGDADPTYVAIIEN